MDIDFHALALRRKLVELGALPQIGKINHSSIIPYCSIKSSTVHRIESYSCVAKIFCFTTTSFLQPSKDHAVRISVSSGTVKMCQPGVSSEKSVFAILSK